MLLNIEDLDLATEREDHVEQRGARWVHADGVEDEVRVREEQGRAEKEGGGGEIAGNGCIDALERLAAGDAQLLACAVKGGPEGPERMFGVITRADGLAEAGSALRLQSGDTHSGLHLRGVDRR